MTTPFTPRFATPNTQATDLVAVIEQSGQKLRTLKDRIETVIFGQEKVINQSLVTLLSGGHLLLIGVPGLAKTRLVETLGIALSLQTKRIQCTPDLMPSDIVGSEVLEESDLGRRSFRFIEGPVFCQLLMADEINRASPRTQSALLQAMQERTVTIAGQTRTLPLPFHVLATQNPLEHEGTYPLPEAQLDRFLMQVDVTYPDPAAEKAMVIATTTTVQTELKPVMNDRDFIDMQSLVRRMPISEQTLDGILTLVREGRPETSSLDSVKRYVTWGPGPRAAQALSLASRARALLDGRLSPSKDDVKELIRPVLQHRMGLSFSARADGITLPYVLDQLARFIET